uniref:RNA chaperone Hfq n=1 Tax=Acidobacterium capsulatum TaxID=33075 RepID=A0A7V5CU05_9BACT
MANLPHTLARPLGASSGSSGQERMAKSSPGKPATLPARTQSQAPDKPAASAIPKARKVEDIDANHAGPRKLIRPAVPAGANAPRGRSARTQTPILSHQEWSALQNATADASHAEAFYFQKQMQSQTPMVFMLDSGEKIEGCIEWYDRYAVKVRHARRRVLIYKSSIKYIYKAAETSSL